MRLLSSGSVTSVQSSFFVLFLEEFFLELDEECLLPAFEDILRFLRLSLSVSDPECGSA